MNKCEVCQKSAAQKCANCHNSYYCSKQHQKDAWKRHKKICKPLKICEDAIVGRYLIATRPIKNGEVVLQEAPLIWGPAQNTIPVCLGCGKSINESDSRPCTKCGWPVCGDLCEKSPGHLPECRYTHQRGDKVTVKNFGIIHPIYQCITVLRCLYQKQFLPKNWSKLEILESHDESRKKSPKYEQERVGIAEFCRRFFKLSSTFSENEIMRVCGIVAVNSHEVPLTEPPHIAIYATTSMLEHSCAANCSKSFTNSGAILISAARHIQAGEHLSICYTDALWGTPNRRHFLHETKYFWCQCARCQDNTEFGTFFSAVRCQNNCTGFLLPESFTEGINKPLDWICSKCLKPTSCYSIHDILERIGRDLADLDKSRSESLKKFIETYEFYLHPNHFYLTDVKYTLSQLLGQEFEGGLPKLSEEDLHSKSKLCKSLRILIEKLAPFEKRTLGLVLFELHAVSAEIGRRRGLDSQDPEEMRFALTESKAILAEAVELLKHEPDSLPEGKIFQQAQRNLKDIDVVLRAVHSSIGDSPT